MKIRVLLLLFIILLVSCQKMDLQSKIDNAEVIYKQNADSAYAILTNSVDPRKLSKDHLIKWCYLTSKIADSIQKKLPSDTLLVEASRLIKSDDKSEQQVYIDYYAARALSSQNRNEEALSFYLKALNQAQKRRMDGLSGYICSYTADLFLAQFDAIQALQFYTKAENYFKKSGNKRSQTIALRDIAKSYSYDKNFEKALSYALQADSMAQSIEEPILRASISGYIGRFYTKLGKYDQAEKYIRYAINILPKHAYQSQLALVDMKMAQDRWAEAKNLLDSLSSSMTVSAQKLVVYKYQYRVEKNTGNFVKALEYLEKENVLADSLRNMSQAKALFEIEQKNAQEQLLNANNKLKIKYQQVIIIVIGLILLLVIIFFFFRNQEHIRAQNELNLKQKLIEKGKETELHKSRLREQELLTKNNQMILKVKEQQLKDAAKRFAMMKDSLFQRSILYEKIKLISNLPIKNEQKRKSYDSAVKDVFGAPSLTEEDWANLKGITDELYPEFTTTLQEQVPALSKDEINFCCLLRFDLSSDKLALLLNITPNTIKSKRYRIMQKAGVTNQNLKLEEYLETIGTSSAHVPE